MEKGRKGWGTRDDDERGMEVGGGRENKCIFYIQIAVSNRRERERRREKSAVGGTNPYQVSDVSKARSHCMMLCVLNPLISAPIELTN